MTEFNWEGATEIAVLTISCIFILTLLTGRASAGSISENATNVSYLPGESYIIVEVPTPDPTPLPEDNLTFLQPSGLNSTGWENVTRGEPAYNNTRISQGQCVEVGGVYDVSGVIGYSVTTAYNEFAYYSRYEDSFDVPEQRNDTVNYIYKIPYRRSAYYNFYLDPKIFGSRLGYWYQYTGVYESNANKRAFYVSDKCIKDANATEFVDANNTPILINPYVMETRPSGADILLSNDDALVMDGQYNDTRVWLFGDTTIILGEDMSNPTVLNSNTTRGLSSGSYTLLLHTPGNDGRYDVEYHQNNYSSSEGREVLIPSTRSIPISDITGFAPQMILPSLTNILDNPLLDDKYTKYSVEVREPFVEITGFQEINVGNASVLEVAGYTNKVPGTPIMLYVDRNEQTGSSDKYPSMTITTENATLGNYRMFHGYIPLLFDNTFPGFHTLTAVLPSGVKSSVDFYIREEAAESVTPPVFHKFIDGNPFIPTPTPIIIEKEVVREVVKTEYKTIIQKEPVDYVTLSWKVIYNLVLPSVAFFVPTVYIGSVLARAFVDRRLRNLQPKKSLEDKS